MIVSKTLMVVGQRITRAGQTINTLGQEIDKALSAVVPDVKSLISVVRNVDFDRNEAIMTVLYEDGNVKKSGKS